MCVSLLKKVQPRSMDFPLKKMSSFFFQTNTFLSEKSNFPYWFTVVVNLSSPPREFDLSKNFQPVRAKRGMASEPVQEVL